MKQKSYFLVIIFLFSGISLAAQYTVNVLSDWMLGGFLRPTGVNPVINPDSSSEFFCPMNNAIVKWEESDAFNPAAVVKDGKICVLYRAEDNSAVGIGKRVSRVALAESTDGVTMTKRATPVLFPADDNNKQYEWPGGCEDPRVAVTEDGTYVVFYTSWDRNVARLCIATSTDLLTWTKYGPAFKNAYNGKYLNTWSKAASIITEIKNDQLVISKVQGQYFMYWGEYRTHAAVSDNLVDWTPLEDENGNLLVLADTRKGYFDSDLVECGPPAVKTDKGILLLYNGKNKTNDDRDFRFNAGTYSAGQMLFDFNDPLKLLERSDVPFFRPVEDYEKSGQYTDGTVFIEGLVYYKSKWFLYYGCADSKVGVAVYDPSKVTPGDPIPDLPKGNGIGAYPHKGVGKKKVSIHSSSGQTNENESAFNLLYSHIDSRKKWCEDSSVNPWVIFELSDYYNVEKLVFRDVAPFENENGNVPEYWIYFSTTGVADADWELIVHKTNQASVNVKEDVLNVPKEARYIKFVASRGTRTDNGNPENAIRIYGFDIHGSFLRAVDRGDIVSVGKTVLAYYDAKQFFSQPIHIIDGNTNATNSWTFDKAGTSDSLKYVILDLEEEYDIEKFVLYDAGNFGSKSNNLSGYKIYLSSVSPNLNAITPLRDNNTTWTQVVDMTGKRGDNVKTSLIEPVKARYVKLEIPRSRTIATPLTISQFEIYKKSNTNTEAQIEVNKLNVFPTVLKSGESINVFNNQPGEINIFSQQGALLFRSELRENTNNKYSLRLPQGNYIVNLKTKKSTLSSKIIIR